jgi:hypothetical protein
MTGVEMVPEDTLKLSEWAFLVFLFKREQTRIVTACAAGLSVPIMANFST